MQYEEKYNINTDIRETRLYSKGYDNWYKIHKSVLQIRGNIRRQQ